MLGEHEFEPQRGLPQRLPAGERLLWQGAPDAGVLARRVFHLRKLALYFAVLVAWRTFSSAHDGASVADIVVAVATGVGLALAALGLLTLIAWLVARTSVYTLTDRRVVMRVGVVLSVTFNLPLRQLDAVRTKVHSDGSGDVALVLTHGQRIAYLHLWPHVRPWRFTAPEPMLRGLPEVATVAKALAGAMTRSPEAAGASAVRMDRPHSHAQPRPVPDALNWPRAA